MTIQNHSNNGGLFKNFGTAKIFTFNKSFVANLSFRILQSLRLLSRQIISFVNRGYFSEHQVKTCLRNTSPRKCTEILTIPGVHLVILPLHSSPDWVFLHRSRCGDRTFPSTFYKSNTVRARCIFADWCFLLVKVKIFAVSIFFKRPPSCCYVVAMVCLVVPSFPSRALLTCAVVIQLCQSFWEGKYGSGLARGEYWEGTIFLLPLLACSARLQSFACSRPPGYASGVEIHTLIVALTSVY